MPRKKKIKDTKTAEVNCVVCGIKYNTVLEGRIATLRRAYCPSCNTCNYF